MKILFRILMFMAIAGLVGGCTGSASEMAAEQPSYKDLTVLAGGTHRHRVIAELGKPELTETVNGAKVDIFRFVQGYSQAARTSRTFAHGTMNIVTFGVWDLAGKPIESAFDGEEVRLRVEYDKDDFVVHVRKYQ